MKKRKKLNHGQKDWGMAKKIGLIILFLVVICGISFGVVMFIRGLNEKIVESQLNDEDWLAKNIKISKNTSLGKNIYSVTRPSEAEVFDIVYQDVIQDKLDVLLEDEYTFENPLMIYNLYGTNTLGLNLYFSTEEKAEVRYTIHVDDKDIDDFSRTLFNGGEDNLTENHQYQIIGLIAGEVNEVTLELLDKDGEEIATKEFSVDLTGVKVNGEQKLDVEDGESKEELTNGLFAMLGNDSDDQDYLALYDNDGILRMETEIIGYRAHRILFKDHKMYYSISHTRIAEVNSLGQVTEIYRTGHYQLHHDYTFDDDGNLIVLANNTKKDTEEDCIIKIDLDTKAVTEVIDFEDMFKSYVKTCEFDDSNFRDEGEDGLDWLHLNSIVWLEGGDVLLSSRETSSILRVNNIEDDPELVYLLADKKIWEDTEFSDYVYEKVGDFKIQAGQHSLNYESTDEDGVYYITFFDNNYGKANSQPDFDYSKLGIENQKPFEGTESYYYVYKVDENKKTFELVDSFDVTYSGIVSSVQPMDNGNVIVDSGTAGVFAEYDEDHKLIRKFTAKLNKYMVYRVFKYTFNDFWFEG
ncbi:MAG TPA: aryl-sulfate sulfotransferase [Candidatus Faecimonas gallistercoris]|nr:aryl-sulfate sulfotransferase [Candidatus Faecimonas gallistercoris]